MHKKFILVTAFGLFVILSGCSNSGNTNPNGNGATPAPTTNANGSEGTANSTTTR